MNFGGKAIVDVEFYRSWGVYYVKYNFTTADGQKISASQKCGNDTLRTNYSLAFYNPQNPNEYELTSDLYIYSPRWRIIFFFLLYLPTMIFVLFNALSMFVKIFYLVKDMLK